MVNKLVGGLVAGLLALTSLGLLAAAAVLGFADLVGVAGGLGIVGGIVAVLALIVLLGMRRRVRRFPMHRVSARGAQLGTFAGGFLLGVWDGLSSRSRRR